MMLYAIAGAVVGAAIFAGGFWFGRRSVPQPQPVEEEKPQYNKSYGHPAIMRFYEEFSMKDNPFFF